MIIAPQTKLFLELEDGGVITGKDTVHGKRISTFKNLGLINTKQISPKPNRKYEIQFTDGGLEVKELILNFIKKIYPIYEADVKKFYKTLEKVWTSL